MFGLFRREKRVWQVNPGDTLKIRIESSDGKYIDLIQRNGTLKQQASLDQGTTVQTLETTIKKIALNY